MGIYSWIKSKFEKKPKPSYTPLTSTQRKLIDEITGNKKEHIMFILEFILLQEEEEKCLCPQIMP